MAIALWWLNLFNAHAQQRQHQGEVWLGYISSVKFASHWAMWNDAHFVPNSFFIHRHGLTWIQSDRFDVTAGYANVYTATSFTNRLVRHEHRPWGQAVVRFGLNKHLSLRARFRYDARFRQAIASEEVFDNYIFYHRLRLFNNLRYNILRDGKHTWHVDLMHEYLYNVGREIPNGTDQHRIFLLAGRNLKGLNLMAGYHLRVIPHTNNMLFRHGFTLWVVHNIQRKCVGDNCAAD